MVLWLKSTLLHFKPIKLNSHDAVLFEILFKAVQTNSGLNSIKARTLFYTSNANPQYVNSVGVQTCCSQFSVRKACLCVCNVYGLDDGAVAKQ